MKGLDLKRLEERRRVGPAVEAELPRAQVSVTQVEQGHRVEVYDDPVAEGL